MGRRRSFILREYAREYSAVFIYLGAEISATSRHAEYLAEVAPLNKKTRLADTPDFHTGRANLHHVTYLSSVDHSVRENIPTPAGMLLLLTRRPIGFPRHRLSNGIIRTPDGMYFSPN